MKILSHYKVIDKNNTYIDSTVTIGENTLIYPNVFIEGNTVIGKNCIIYPGSRIINSSIGDNVTIESSQIIDSTLYHNISVGPYAHIREKCEIESNTRIGNFVEFKKVKFSENSKCAHLTYLGDAIIGRNVNIGCGVVTVNYDGVQKYQTIIEDDCFIGSNVNLIAPVHIKAKALIAAGSTITNDVEEGELGIARSRQENKANYGNQLYLLKQNKKK